MSFSRAVLAPCTRYASLEQMALTSTPCEQSARLRPATASCMLVRHGGVLLTKQTGPRLAGSCEDCSSRLVSPARQRRTSTTQSAQPNSNCSVDAVQSNEFHVLRSLFPPGASS